MELQTKFMKQVLLVCLISLFNIFLLKPVLYAQSKFVVFGGVELPFDQTSNKLNYKTLGADYQYKIGKHLVLGTGIHFKVFKMTFPTELERWSNVTGIGLVESPGMFRMLVSSSDPVYVFSDKILHNTSLAFPLFVGLQLKRNTQLPMLFKLGMGNQLVPHFDFKAGERFDKTWVYTNNLQIGLQVPIWSASTFGLSLEPYYMNGRPVHQNASFTHFRHELEKENWYGIRMQVHLFGKEKLIKSSGSAVAL